MHHSSLGISVAYSIRWTACTARGTAVICKIVYPKAFCISLYYCITKSLGRFTKVTLILKGCDIVCVCVCVCVCERERERERERLLIFIIVVVVVVIVVVVGAGVRRNDFFL